MASKVEICNIALQKFGAKPIVALDEDSVNARACNIAYEPVKLAELRSHTWNFATKRFSLAANAIPPEFGFNNAFTVPSDYVRLLPPDPYRNTEDLDWSIEGKNILTNDSAPLQGRYVANIDDPNLMDPLFRESFSCRLALQLVEALSQSTTKKESIRTDYKNAIGEARRTNAIEKPVPKVADDSWVTVRR